MSQIKLYISFCQVLKIYLITKNLAQIKIALVLEFYKINFLINFPQKTKYMRNSLLTAEKIVIKIGTSSLTYPNGKLNFRKIKNFVEAIMKVSKSGKKIILVSSGAVGIGAGRLGLNYKPQDLAEKQALAGIGQAELIKIYRKFFAEHNQNVAQVLLTRDNLSTPIRVQNATNTLNTLREMNIIPIINENDTVSTDEIIFGDNDSLSADVAIVSQSDLLIILSDIDNLYSADPKVNPSATALKLVTCIDESIEKLATGTGSSFGTGGMQTKITAAKKCLDANIHMVIARADRENVLSDVIAGEDVGTLFFAKKIDI
jgi:glutamate 5-kinase